MNLDSVKAFEAHWPGRSGSRADAQRTRRRTWRASGGVDGETIGRDSRGHPQDRARDRRDAGESLVRQLLRHVPRRRRHPDRCGRRADGLHPRSRRGRCAAPYHDPPTTTAAVRTERRRRRPTSNGGAMDGFVAQSRGSTVELHGSTNPMLRARWPMDVMGYHDRVGHPELLELRAQLRAPGPHVRAEPLVELARSTCSRCRAGRRKCSDARSEELRNEHAANRPSSTRAGPRRIYAWTDLTYLLHKHGVSWGYYVARQRARLRKRRSAQLRRAARDAKTPGSGTRCRSSTRSATTASSATSSRCRTSTAPRTTGTLPAVSWVVPSGRRQRAPAGVGEPPARRT